MVFDRAKKSTRSQDLTQSGAFSVLNLSQRCRAGDRVLQCSTCGTKNSPMEDSLITYDASLSRYH